MSVIPSMSKIKMFAMGALGFAVTAYVVTRLTPGLAQFVGLNPGGSAIPNGSILTPPNVNELMGRPSGRPSASPASQALSVYTPQGQNAIIDAILG